VSRFSGQAYRVLRHGARRAQWRYNLRGAHEFVDRRRGSDRLIIVLAGHKQYLWPHTIERIARFAPADADVCLVSPGVESGELDRVAGRNGWSRLRTRRNQVALAQNLAIAHHPEARWIYKVDEDVLVGEGFFDALQAGYRRVENEGRFAGGLVAPVLNVNGYSYRVFLDTLGLTDAYRERFGELRQACIGVRAQADGEAARWLWEHSVPFDEIAERFRRQPFAWSAAPHRFSIGAMLMQRDMWEHMHGYSVDPASPGVGDDEAQICMACTDSSRVIAVLHDVFAGHVSFGPQEAAMRAALPELAAGLSITPKLQLVLEEVEAG
jgi:hypothetical protein